MLSGCQRHPGIRAVPGSMFFILLQPYCVPLGACRQRRPMDAYVPGKLVRLRPGRNPLSHSFAPDTPLTASTDDWFECNKSATPRLRGWAFVSPQAYQQSAVLMQFGL